VDRRTRRGGSPVSLQRCRARLCSVTSFPSVSDDHRAG
jgi:hypothetical protein